MSKENDGRDAESSESAASFASLGTDCNSVLELGIGGLATSTFGAGLGMAGGWGFIAGGG
jgi:hypothetical protein